jgi:hypothetical protein
MSICGCYWFKPTGYAFASPTRLFCAHRDRLVLRLTYRHWHKQNRVASLRPAGKYSSGQLNLLNDSLDFIACSYRHRLAFFAAGRREMCCSGIGRQGTLRPNHSRRCRYATGRRYRVLALFLRRRRPILDLASSRVDHQLGGLGEVPRALGGLVMGPPLAAERYWGASSIQPLAWE